MTDRFPIYGGPLDGRHYQNDTTIYCQREAMAPVIHGGPRTPRADKADYEYHLVELVTGSKAFVPTFNDDLLVAHQRAEQEGGDDRAHTLLAQIERRGLAI